MKSLSTTDTARFDGDAEFKALAAAQSPDLLKLRILELRCIAAVEAGCINLRLVAEQIATFIRIRLATYNVKVVLTQPAFSYAG